MEDYIDTNKLPKMIDAQIRVETIGTIPSTLMFIVQSTPWFIIQISGWEFITI
jgi:hypothetical protein